MKFDPKTDKELELMEIVPEGLYPCEVADAKDKVSRSGNEMIELKLKLWDEMGRERLVFDYLLPQMAKKLKHFAVASGMLDKYDHGSISAMDCIGKSITAEIGIQEGQDKPDGSGKYPAKNAVKDYMIATPQDMAAKRASQAAPVDQFNDSIPF